MGVYEQRVLGEVSVSIQGYESAATNGGGCKWLCEQPIEWWRPAVLGCCRPAAISGAVSLKNKQTNKQTSEKQTRNVVFWIQKIGRREEQFL